jgi:hypothetical protein
MKEHRILIGVPLILMAAGAAKILVDDIALRMIIAISLSIIAAVIIRKAFN